MLPKNDFRNPEIRLLTFTYFGTARSKENCPNGKKTLGNLFLYRVLPKNDFRNPKTQLLIFTYFGTARPKKIVQTQKNFRIPIFLYYII